MRYGQGYWDQRWNDGQTGWDVGYPSTPLVEYFDQLENKEMRILIPGCGNAYEAEYLYQNGITNVYVMDISPLALESFKKRVPIFPESHLIEGDFFEFVSKFDLIVEQTFFCALHPTQRENYCLKVLDLLNPGGKLIGVLFNDPLFEDHPPYGALKEEYEIFFPQYFQINALEECHNSIKPRAGREVFINFEAKPNDD